ncbi:hypothetical protein M8J75_015304 [Diaphorina citri]|nr:hypothetical protein M8J75_015304 [Diaphorina citri]
MLRKSLKAQSEQRLLLAEVLSKISTGITGSNELTYLSKFQKHSVRATLLTLVRLCFTNEVANQLGYTAAKTGTKPYFHNSVFFWGTLFYFQNVS